MSVQFGRWNFDGKPVEQDYLEKVQPLLLPYGPDDSASYSNGPIGMLYFGFHTTRESRRERQPHIMSSGAIITWDGRLDNRAELIRAIGEHCQLRVHRCLHRLLPPLSAGEAVASHSSLETGLSQSGIRARAP